MARLLIVYATTEGQTRKIADWLAEQARGRGHDADAHDAAALPAGLDMAGYDAAIVAGSVHMGHHQAAVEHFVKAHRPALERKPAAFVSVSLSAAGDAEDRADALACAEQFLAQTGWHPARVHLAAGAFRFTQYDFFRRWIMRRIAREKHQPTQGDTEYTDWADLGRFLDSFLADVAAG